MPGVFFRKFTRNQANLLDLKGYCRNTSRGTVQGVIEGPLTQVNAMKEWLKNVGSPESHIDQAKFQSQTPIESHTFSTFTIKK